MARWRTLSRHPSLGAFGALPAGTQVMVAPPDPKGYLVGGGVKWWVPDPTAAIRVAGTWSEWLAAVKTVSTAEISTYRTVATEAEVYAAIAAEKAAADAAAAATVAAAEAAAQKAAADAAAAAEAAAKQAAAEAAAKAEAERLAAEATAKAIADAQAAAAAKAAADAAAAAAAEAAAVAVAAEAAARSAAEQKAAADAAARAQAEAEAAARAQAAAEAVANASAQKADTAQAAVEAPMTTIGLPKPKPTASQISTPVARPDVQIIEVSREPAKALVPATAAVAKADAPFAVSPVVVVALGGGLFMLAKFLRKKPSGGVSGLAGYGKRRKASKKRAKRTRSKKRR